MDKVSCRRISWAPLLLLAAILGCGDARPQASEECAVAPVETGRQFDEASAGTIQGRVSWEGPVPRVPPFEIPANLLAAEIFHSRQVRPNPNAPVIDSGSKGVANAVVFLRGIEPLQSRPWDLPDVRVEQRAGQFHILQGQADSTVGFVRRGTGVELVSRDSYFHSVHAGGAAFFTLAFPDPEQPLQRVFRDKGLVELTSQAGCYWMRGYLFVDDHPYYTRTDAGGRFRFTQVPPGRYEVVSWLPNWQKERHERDPESGTIARLYFRKPLERAKTVTLQPRGMLAVSFVFSAEADPKAGLP